MCFIKEVLFSIYLLLFFDILRFYVNFMIEVFVRYVIWPVFTIWPWSWFRWYPYDNWKNIKMLELKINQTNAVFWKLEKSCNKNWTSLIKTMQTLLLVWANISVWKECGTQFNVHDFSKFCLKNTKKLLYSAPSVLKAVWH